MVSRDSAIAATPDGREADIFSIDKDHSDIVKFKYHACPDYLNVRFRITTLVEDAPGIISKCFADQEEGGRASQLVVFNSPQVGGTVVGARSKAGYDIIEGLPNFSEPLHLVAPEALTRYRRKTTSDTAMAVTN